MTSSGDLGLAKWKRQKVRAQIQGPIFYLECSKLVLLGRALNNAEKARQMALVRGMFTSICNGR